MDGGHGGRSCARWPGRGGTTRRAGRWASPPPPRGRCGYPGFAAACNRALARGAATLEQVAFGRAVEGWEKPNVYAGKIVGHRRRYPDPLLRLLLQREAVGGDGRGGRRDRDRPEVATAEEANVTLLELFAAMKERTQEGERERMLAWAGEMRRRGLAP